MDTVLVGAPAAPEPASASSTVLTGVARRIAAGSVSFLIWSSVVPSINFMLNCQRSSHSCKAALDGQLQWLV